MGAKSSKQKGGNKKHGRNKIKSERYLRENRRKKNKERKEEKRQKRLLKRRINRGINAGNNDNQ